MCGSALAEMLQGMNVEEASQLTRDDIVKAVGGLPTRKHHAAALAIETLQAAINESKKHGAGGSPPLNEFRS